jgi:hypothetical protein
MALRELINRGSGSFILPNFINIKIYRVNISLLHENISISTESGIVYFFCYTENAKVNVFC